MRKKIARFAAFALIYIMYRYARAARSFAKRLYFIFGDYRNESAPSYLAFMDTYHSVLSLFGVKTPPSNSEKFVFCRPRGGLTNMLCRIDRCASYALRYNRVIYIDGTRGGFLDDFSRYFAIRERERERERESGSGSAR
ncbi:MAG: hypothetical protein LBO72_09825 [Helicobacteraceae bacterium]|nr:hypothetical protein [Helicobacteraceae bacterium]